MRPHERLLQMLSALLIQVNTLQRLLEPEKNAEERLNADALREGMTVLEQMTRELLYVVRSTGDELPVGELEGVTLADALSRLVEETAETAGLSSRVSFSGVDDQGRPREHILSRPAERLLYLVARESLYQVQQRTGARRLRFTLSYGQEDAQMMLEDDGVNAPTPHVVPDIPPAPSDQIVESNAPLAALAPPQFAPRSNESIMNDLRYRLEHMGGTLEVQQSERGTRVTARLPYAPHVHPDTTNPAKALSPVASANEPAREPSSTPTAPIRLLIVDGQAVTRAGLRHLLESYPGLQVVGEATDGVQAVSETLELGPQVVLMDSQLPNGQSIEALRQIKQLDLDTRVLLISAQDREEYLYETLRAGADGYVLKDIAPDELAEAVRIVGRGEVLVQPSLAGRLLSRVGRSGRNGVPYEALTARELEVLRLLARGLRNKEIAARLFVSERTVNFHLANIYQKLNVSGRTEALSKALEQGLISA